jgi:hypothetical protein
MPMYLHTRHTQSMKARCVRESCGMCKEGGAFKAKSDVQESTQMVTSSYEQRYI